MTRHTLNKDGKAGVEVQVPDDKAVLVEDMSLEQSRVALQVLYYAVQPLLRKGASRITVVVE